MSGYAKVDVLVVGLGPAGASAAAEAARGGLRVIGIDRKRTAGMPVQCAEFVPGPLCGEVAGLTRAVRQPIHAMATMLATQDPYKTSDFRGSMIDRAAFDQMLVAGAKSAGAQIILGSSVRSIASDGARFADGRIIDADIIIGADGPHSLVGRAIGSINTEIVDTRQITVPLPHAHAATDIHLSPDYRGGYGWLFPKDDVAHVGLGIEPPLRHRLKPLLEALHKRLIREGRVGQEILALTGGPIPVGGLLLSAGVIGGRTLLLAGDAAGLANAVTGAGIASAVQSGRMAGRAAVAFAQGKTGAGTAYAEELDDVFGPSLRRAVRRRRELLLNASPSAADMRRGWIAYPEYWSPFERPTA